jgi:RNA polymerase sigma-70 factor (ECF subfamily)
MASQTDEYYIERVLQGDHSSYALLVERHKDMVFTLAYRMLKNREEAEEIAQDAFLKAYSSLKNFRRKSKFSTWIYRIVYNLAVSHLRKNKKQVQSLDDQEHPLNLEDASEKMDSLEAGDRQKFVQQALSKLSHDEQTIMTLYYQDDLPVGEIAEITQMTQSNVKVKLHRARKRLHDHLGHILKHEINSLL